MARSVAAGEYAFALNNFVNLSLNVKLAGGPIEYFPLDPVPLFFAQVAVSAKAPNPNAARLAANFLLSRDAQLFYTKFGRLPTRTDVPTNPPGVVEALNRHKVVRTQFRPGGGEAPAPNLRHAVQEALKTGPPIAKRWQCAPFVYCPACGMLSGSEPTGNAAVPGRAY